MISSTEMKDVVSKMDYAGLIELEDLIEKAKLNIARKDLLDELNSLLIAFYNVEEAVTELDFEDLLDKDWFSKNYPFEKSFDDLTSEVEQWIKTLKESV